MQKTTVTNQSQPLADQLARCQIQDGHYSQPLSVTPLYEIKEYLTKAPEAPKGAHPPHPAPAPCQQITRRVAINNDEISGQTQSCLIKSLTYLAENEAVVNGCRILDDAGTVFDVKGDAFKLTFNKKIEGGCSDIYYASFSAQQSQSQPKYSHQRDFVIKVAKQKRGENDWVIDQLGVTQFNKSLLYSNVKRLIQEIKMLSSLAAHPNIIPILGFSYLGYPPKEERSLIDTFAIFPKYDCDAHNFFIQHPSIQHMIRFLCQIMQGLIFLQNKNIVHQDIKLENCFIQSKDFHCVVADFGSAIPLEKNQTAYDRNLPITTLSSLPPERFHQGQINHTFDTVGWALMILDLSCLIGRLYNYPTELYLTTIDFPFNNDFFANVISLKFFMQNVESPPLQNNKFNQELETLRIKFKDKRGSEAIHQFYKNAIDQNNMHRLAHILAPCLVSVIQENVDQRASKEALLAFLEPMTDHPLASKLGK